MVTSVYLGVLFIETLSAILSYLNAMSKRGQAAFTAPTVALPREVFINNKCEEFNSEYCFDWKVDINNALLLIVSELLKMSRLLLTLNTKSTMQFSLPSPELRIKLATQP